jgi:hypothetical protein
VVSSVRHPVIFVSAAFGLIGTRVLLDEGDLVDREAPPTPPAAGVTEAPEAA